MNKKAVDQVAKIINGSLKVEELVQIERMVKEAKKGIVADVPLGYWAGKTPCWQMNACPSYIREECPSYRLRSQPCWEMEGTYCKLNDYGSTGQDTSICMICRVYKIYGNGESIEIKLFGQGIDADFFRHLKDQI
ncbi:MAG TPA: hypothetical protein VF318_08070 [Dehalococcoidales bacterium]